MSWPCSPDSLRAAETEWKAGLAKAVITPESGVWLAGYGSKRPPDGKLHDLWMKALALEDAAGHRVVLVTSDFQGVPKGMSDPVFKQLEQQFGLQRADVMITFSHNHCGPRLGDDLVDYYPVEARQVELVNAYTAEMQTRLVAMVGEALSKLAPARLQTGEGKATFAVNRRNNREAEVPALLAQGVPLKGPVDHAVPVMTVTRPDGSLAAVLFGYACHPTTLSFTTWCGDYPGFAQLELEQKHPGAMAMFVNTCGGDQNPLPRRSVELCQRYGHMLADAVEQTLGQPLKPVSSGLRTAFEYVDLPYLKVVSREELHAAMHDKNAIRARWAARMLQKLDQGANVSRVLSVPGSCLAAGQGNACDRHGRRNRGGLCAAIQTRVWPRHVGLRVCRRHDRLHSLAARVGRRGLRRGLQPVRIRPPCFPLGGRYRGPHLRVGAQLTKQVGQ